MLKITIPGVEFWDEENEVFLSAKSQTITLEHSLVSLSKWESKWKKPFLTKKELSAEELLDYIRCMTLTQNVDSTVYRRLTPENLKSIRDYIDSPMTATIINEPPGGKVNREIMTSELIYYYMTANNIPFECQKWHLNRLLTLIRICGIKNGPQKKMRNSEIMRRNAALNAARRKKYHTRG